MLKKTYQKGFTVVELLIVIVVIGILAALVLNTFAGIQQRARDTERKTDINAIATQLEAWYNTEGQGSYPTQAEIESGIFEGLDDGALSAPGQTGSSLVNNGTPTKDQYGYVVASDGSAFELYWLIEDTGDTEQKDSLNGTHPITP